MTFLFKPLGIRLVLSVLFAASLASGFMGCSGKSVEETDPAVLYKDAEEDIKNDHYQIASDKLRTVRNKFPYSKYAVDAQLRLADVHYMQEEFAEAAAAYETFRDLHPKHEKIEYAMFRIGKSYFKDIPSTIARDLTTAQKAADAYQEFIRRFPNAGNSQEARDDLATSRRLLAQKELSIGNFYFKRDFFDSAKGRYLKIINNYADSPYVDEAKEKLAEIADHEAKHAPKRDDESKGSADHG